MYLHLIAMLYPLFIYLVINIPIFIIIFQVNYVMYVKPLLITYSCIQMNIVVISIRAMISRIEQYEYSMLQF